MLIVYLRDYSEYSGPIYNTTINQNIKVGSIIVIAPDKQGLTILVGT